MFDRSDSVGNGRPASRSRWDSPNFWIVEKTMPPDSRAASSSFR
jgi:hypothetical protein